MTNPATVARPIGIAAVERETGLSQHLLRAWESRYGFPAPSRDAAGERLYDKDQVARLHLLRRLIERGHRPGKIVALPAAELRRLADGLPPPRSDGTSPLDAALYLEALARLDLVTLRRQLQSALLRQGLERFVLETLRPLTRWIGEAWAAGEIDISHEHLFTEQIERMLQEAMAPLQPSKEPVVLLATVSQELHRVGLLMLEALFRLEDVRCIPVGTGLPPTEITSFATASGAHVVALSFSAAYKGSAKPLLSDMRRGLDTGIEIWCGGAGARRSWQSIHGLRVMPTLEDGVEALRLWRRQRG